jgi:hypothetical protein
MTEADERKSKEYNPRSIVRRVGRDCSIQDRCFNTLLVKVGRTVDGEIQASKEVADNGEAGGEWFRLSTSTSTKF